MSALASGIAAFITARLDEREQVARLAARKGAAWKQDDPERFPGAICSETGPVVYDEGAPDEHQAAHIVLNDPFSVLRDVAARRAILAEHAPQTDWPEHCQRCITVRVGYPEQWADDPWPCTTLRLLAASWSDHPDYDPAWAPS